MVNYLANKYCWSLQNTSHAIDNAGNENWDEVRINVPFFADSASSSSSEVGVAQLLPSSSSPSQS
jgi:hypothetical protein